MRLAVITLALLVLSSAPATTLAASPADARLTIAFFRDGGDPSTRVRWTLECSPTGGSYPRRMAACSVLDRLGRSVFAPVPLDKACTEIYGGPQVVVISGQVDGRRVWARFRRDNGCQIDRWERAGALLPRTSGVG